MLGKEGRKKWKEGGWRRRKKKLLFFLFLFIRMDGDGEKFLKK